MPREAGLGCTPLGRATIGAANRSPARFSGRRPGARNLEGAGDETRIQLQVL